jgi:hypothetical protein
MFPIPLIRFIAALLAAAASAFALPAHAEAFVCTDAKGGVHAGDVPPPECARQPVKVLRSDGADRGVIAAPLTAAEREQRAESQAAAEAEHKRLADRRNADEALLRRFDNEGEIRAAEARDLAGVDSIIRAANEKLERLARQRRRLDDEAEFFVGRKMPEHLRSDIATNESEVAQQRHIIDKAGAERDSLRAKYDATARRFQELTAR